MDCVSNDPRGCRLWRTLDLLCSVKCYVKQADLIRSPLIWCSYLTIVISEVYAFLWFSCQLPFLLILKRMLHIFIEADFIYNINMKSLVRWGHRFGRTHLSFFRRIQRLPERTTASVLCPALSAFLVPAKDILSFVQFPFLFHVSWSVLIQKLPSESKHAAAAPPNTTCSGPHHFAFLIK